MSNGIKRPVGLNDEPRTQADASISSYFLSSGSGIRTRDLRVMSPKIVA